jgi:hypothetical protein
MRVWRALKRSLTPLSGTCIPLSGYFYHFLSFFFLSVCDFFVNTEMMQIAKAKRKPSKESYVTHATGAQELKHRKPKPTNPKPFRLRTDVCTSLSYLRLRNSNLFNRIWEYLIYI